MTKLDVQIKEQLIKSFQGFHKPLNKENTYKSSPFLATQKREELLELIHKFESLLDLYGQLHRLSDSFGSIDIRKNLKGDLFYEQYYCANKPVIIQGLMNDWPALKKWTPQYFKEEFGNIEVEVTKGRNNEEAYEKNFNETTVKMSFGKFADEIINKKVSNDIYMVARNRFFSNPGAKLLEQDVIPPSDIIDNNFSGRNHMKLWFGPEGTVTPLHHDKQSILFCQIYGKKYFKMIPSFDLSKMYCDDKYYSRVDPEKVNKEKYPRFLEASIKEVVIHPGEMLFIPAGWWHWVKSLDVSISLTLSNFLVPNFNTPWNCK